MRVYEPVGSLHRCVECSERNLDPALTRHEGYGDAVLVADPATHDRWHNERAAAADPAQGALL